MRATIVAGIAWIATSIVGSNVAMAQASTDDEVVVAVPGLRALHGDDDAAHELTGWLRAGASAIEGWRLHATVASLEQFMLVNGCDAPDEVCLTRVAETLGAARLISGSFSRVKTDDGYDFEAELFLFDAETGQIEKTSTVTLERDRVRPGELAVIGQKQAAALAGKPFDEPGQAQAADLEQAQRDGEPLEARLAMPEEPVERFPIWPSAVSYASGAVFIGLTAWSWTTIRNVEQNPSFDAARRLAGPDVNDVCSADTDFGVSDLDSLCAKANTHEKLQWVFLGMSAASVGVGTWLLVKSIRSNKSRDRARIQVTPVAGRRSGGMSARLRF